MTPDDLDIINEEIQKDAQERKADAADGGYKYGRIDKTEKFDLVPYDPVSMRHFLLCQDPNTHILDKDNPIYKVMGKIKISNMLFGHSFAAGSVKPGDTEDTTIRSHSSASRIHDIKNTYRKQQQNTEETAQGEMTSTLGSGNLLSQDFKRSILSNTASKGFGSSVGFQRMKSEPAADFKIHTDKHKKSKPRIKFNSDYKPSILSTDTCKKK